jgi:hypothetical protein
MMLSTVSIDAGVRAGGFGAGVWAVAATLAAAVRATINNVRRMVCTLIDRLG